MDAFADYESDEEEKVGNAPPPPAASKGERKGAEDTGSAGAGASAVGGKSTVGTKRKLPSAASMLASGGSKPSFLQSKQDQDEIEEIKLVEEVPEVSQTASKSTTEPVAKKTAPQGTSKAAAAAAAQPPKAAGRGTAKEKDVKDKVKQQRVRGQSAHERWKSEGEMLLRQQFD